MLYKIRYKNGASNFLADALSRNPVNDIENKDVKVVMRGKKEKLENKGISEDNDNNKIALSNNDKRLKTYRKTRKNIPKNKNRDVGKNNNDKLKKGKVGRPRKVVVEDNKSDYDESSY